MLHELRHTEGNDRLLLVFAGWGMDAEPLRHLQAPPTYDVMTLWDYRDDAFPDSLLEPYGEVAVLAWSFGVPAAARFLASRPDLPVTCRVAVNGTQTPVSDLTGIPEAIFQGTLEGLQERTLAKFHRRMCGSAQALRHFPVPRRAISELRDELRAIASRPATAERFDTAYVSQDDRIIPPDNQRRAWSSGLAARVIDIPGPHLPDFQALVRRILTDKPLVARRFARASTSYSQAASVQLQVARRLLDLWDPDPCDHPDVLEVGCGNGLSTRELLRRLTPRTLTLVDLAIDPDVLPACAVKIQGDAEIEVGRLHAKSRDVVFSSSAMQWFNSAAAFLSRASRVLRHSGRAVIATYGDDTYADLRRLSGIERRYPTPDELRRMVPPSLRLDHIEAQTLERVFPSPADLLRHVRATGVGASVTSMSPTQAARQILRLYPRDPSGACRLPYQAVYLLLTKP